MNHNDPYEEEVEADEPLGEQNEPDEVWDTVHEIEDELFDELNRIQDKYRVPINVVANLAAAAARKMESLALLYAIKEDQEKLPDPELN